MENILYALIVLVICFIGLSVRILFKEKGTFRGSCSSINITGDEKCSICGKEADEIDCKKSN